MILLKKTTPLKAEQMFEGKFVFGGNTLNHILDSREKKLTMGLLLSMGIGTFWNRHRYRD